MALAPDDTNKDNSANSSGPFDFVQDATKETCDATSLIAQPFSISSGGSPIHRMHH